MKNRIGFINNISPETPSLSDSPLFISIIIFSIIMIFGWKYFFSAHIDNLYYQLLAKGLPVNKPFSGRIFYPTIAHILQKCCGLSLNYAFALSNSLGLLMLIFTVTVIIKSITSYAILAVPLLFTPLLVRSSSLVFLPDLFSAGLTGIFFYLLYRSYFWPSLLVLLMVFLTRENAIFLCLSIAVVGLYKSRLRWAVGGIVILIMGIVITSWAGRFGLPQEYSMNFLLYLALKVPKNFLYNVFGILIWTNVYPEVGHPYFLIALPGWLPLGKLHTIGITPVQPLVSLNTIMLLLTTFGVAPSLLTITLIKNWKKIFLESQFWLLVAIIYGVSSFLMGVAVSYDVMRLVGYAWPAFWLAVPALLLKCSKFSPSSLAKLISFHILTCWLPWIMRIPWFVDTVTIESPIPFLAVIFTCIMLHILANRTINYTYGKMQKV